MKTKICVKCNIEKDLSAFYNDKSTSDGKRNSCKKCSNIQHKNYCIRNQNIIRIKHIKYKQNNSNRIKRSNAKYYQNNKDSIKIKQAEWVKNNPRKIAKFSKNRRAKRKGWGKPLSINKYFEGSHLHHLHINKDHQTCIYIPSKLHKSIWHAYNRPETMITINLEIMRWYYGLTIKW